MDFLVGAHFIPSLILIAGVINDLKSRKVRNNLILACAILAIGFSFFTGGMNAVNLGLLALAGAFLFSLPFVLMGFLGAGDMKLLMAFALSVRVDTVLYVFVFAFLWGAILGFVQIIYKGQLKKFFQNVFSLLRARKVEKSQLHTIPYTVALFLGWLTYLSLKQHFRFEEFL